MTETTNTTLNPIDRPCEECGAQAGEPCRPFCTAEPLEEDADAADDDPAPTREHTAATELDAHAARRQLINAGHPVSLVAYDPTRDLYVFDDLTPAVSELVVGDLYTATITGKNGGRRFYRQIEFTAARATVEEGFGDTSEVRQDRIFVQHWEQRLNRFDSWPQLVVSGSIREGGITTAATATSRSRTRRPKLFKVTREERTVVTFYVQATSALKARQTATPTFAKRYHRFATAGEAVEVYSLPSDEQAIAYSPVDRESAGRS